MVAAKYALLSRIDASILEQLLAAYPRRDFQIRLWDGTTWGTQEQPQFTLVLKRPEVLRAIFSDPSELTLGEAYVYDDFDIEGDIEAAFDLADHLLSRQSSVREHLQMLAVLHLLPSHNHQRVGPQPVRLRGSVHSKSRDRQAISYHYDLPASFYALWLDPRMVYSCAYFARPDENLDTAQQRKLDYICKKLRLCHGDRFLDIGCGWGGLLIHAAAHYGVEAVGITLSVPQAELARERIQQAGLSERCRVEVCDYRDLESTQHYNKIVSVGMFEHVGEARLAEYFARAWNLLQPGGLFLNHGIAYSATYRRRGPSFTERYVFPDGEMVPISSSLRAAEASGFEVRDVESLREHYALTLHHWVQRLVAHAEEARRITDERTYRVWRIYMAGSAHAFRVGRLNVFQALLSKSTHGQCGLPLTREVLYR